MKRVPHSPILKMYWTDWTVKGNSIKGVVCQTRKEMSRLWQIRLPLQFSRLPLCCQCICHVTAIDWRVSIKLRALFSWLPESPEHTVINVGCDLIIEKTAKNVQHINGKKNISLISTQRKIMNVFMICVLILFLQTESKDNHSFLLCIKRKKIL